MLGLIVPGGWEEFFRSIGDPYSGPAWPLSDSRSFADVLLPRLQAASEKFDMIPVPNKQHFAPQDWDGSEKVLPGKETAYFLAHASGPAYVLGGMVMRPLITTAEASLGRFAIGALEGSKQHGHASIFCAGEGKTRMLRFRETQHAFHVFSGAVSLMLQQEHPGQRTESTLHAGELAYVPAGTAFRLEVSSRLARVYVFCSGPGLVELMRELGEAYEGPVVPEKAEESAVEEGKIREVGERFGVEVC